MNFLYATFILALHYFEGGMIYKNNNEFCPKEDRGIIVYVDEILSNPNCFEKIPVRLRGFLGTVSSLAVISSRPDDITFPLEFELVVPLSPVSEIFRLADESNMPSHICTENYVEIYGYFDYIEEFEGFGIRETYSIRTFESKGFLGTGEICLADGQYVRTAD